MSSINPPHPSTSGPESGPLVSFCLIACNEETRLDKCLSSVKGLCDELVVIDTGSTDQTAERARELGAQVYSYEWTDDFAQARNFGLAKLAGDWILMLDADEYLYQEAAQKIRSLIKQPDNLVINLMRREIGATQSPWSLVSRLFRRHPEVKFERPYHAMIDDSVERLVTKETHWQIQDLDLPAIAHVGYRPEEIAGQQKAGRAQRAMERYHAKHSDDPYVCSKLGALLHSTGKTKQAEALLKTGLSVTDNTPASAHLRYELHYHLGLLHRSQSRNQSARKHYRKALDEPLDPRLMAGASLNLAALDQLEGKMDQAIQRYRELIQNVPDLTQAYLNLGLAERAKGNDQAAKRHYLSILAIDPEHPDAHRNLGVLHLNQGRQHKAVQCFTKALAGYEKRDPEQAASFRKALEDAGVRI